MSQRNPHTPSPTRILFFGMLTAFLMVSYQNCGKGQHVSNSSSRSSVTVATEVNPPIATMSDALNGDFIFYPINPTDPFDWPDHYYNINLQNQTAQKVTTTATTNLNVLSSIYDANHTWGQELLALMQTSTVCKQLLPAPSAGTQCLENVSVPHTQVTFGDETFGLGSLTSSCATELYDICEAQRANYRQVISQFLCVVEPATCNTP